MKNKLDKEFKDRWLHALRSGEYYQGINLLYDIETNKYCCLGVAAHLCGIDLKGYMARRGYIYEETNSYPAILTPNASNESVARILANMNDEGKTFAEIADWIEENL